MPQKNTKRMKIKRKLKDEIICLGNADKDGWTESWYEGRNIIDFPHPFRLCILGKVSMGKSTIAKNVFLRCQMGETPFQELYIIHGSTNTKEYDEFDPTMILNDIPHPNELNTTDKKTLIMIDDFEMSNLPKESITNLSSIFRYVSSHHNISIIVCYQSFFDVPSIVRKCANVFTLYKPNDIDELGTIGRRCGIKKDDITYIFETILTKPRDTLTIDMTENSPAKLRKNLFLPIVKED